jgi:hypothetical protein
VGQAFSPASPKAGYKLSRKAQTPAPRLRRRPPSALAFGQAPVVNRAGDQLFAGARFSRSNTKVVKNGVTFGADFLIVHHEPMSSLRNQTGRQWLAQKVGIWPEDSQAIWLCWREVLMGTETDSCGVTIESRTIQKVRRRIIPFIFVLYFVCFLDRINIGFAALTMNKDLGITSQQFGLIGGIFFFGYFLFEVPSNLLLHRIGARIWIARILIVWGALAALTGFVHSVNQLYIVRFLLGLAEAGYFPGMVLYLTYWLPQREQARAVALLLTGIPAVNILGAPISGLILDHVHWLGLGGWRWLLILEGIPGAILGLLTYFLLPNGPNKPSF